MYFFFIDSNAGSWLCHVIRNAPPYLCIVTASPHHLQLSKGIQMGSAAEFGGVGGACQVIWPRKLGPSSPWCPWHHPLFPVCAGASCAAPVELRYPGCSCPAHQPAAIQRWRLQFLLPASRWRRETRQAAIRNIIALLLLLFLLPSSSSSDSAASPSTPLPIWRSTQRMWGWGFL